MHPTRGRPIPIRCCSRKPKEPAAASTPWLVAASVQWPSWQVSKGASDRYEASFGCYLNNARVERLENMTFTELRCELPDHAGWRQTASMLWPSGSRQIPRSGTVDIWAEALACRCRACPPRQPLRKSVDGSAIRNRKSHLDTSNGRRFQTDPRRRPFYGLRIRKILRSSGLSDLLRESSMLDHVTFGCPGYRPRQITRESSTAEPRQAE
jgi:hypothetical protein